MDTSAERTVAIRSVLGDDGAGATDFRRRGVSGYKTAVTAARDHLSMADEWARELTAVPTDQRREVAELVSRLKVLAGEIERLT